LLRGLARLVTGRNEEALQDFLLANTYPENLQAGRPGDAGQAPKLHYYTAKAYQAMGQAGSAQVQLRAALEGRVANGEMSYYRLLACRELGDEKGEADQRQRLQSAIAALENPDVVDAYAKFGGENSPAERVGHRTTESLYLRGLAALVENKTAEAKEQFEKALKERPSMIWAKAMRGRSSGF
jgi:tetratricopeptide (TPR) repeat protein